MVGFSMERDVLGRPIGLDFEDTMPWDLWEFHAGSQAITREAAYYGQMTCGFPVDIVTGWDLANPLHQEALRLEVVKHRPRVLVLAPSSKPWISSGSTIDAPIKGYFKERENRTLGFLRTLAELQREQEADFVWLGLKDDRLWQEEEVRKVVNISHGEDLQTLHMCAHGLQEPATKLPIKQPVTVACSFQLRNVTQSCPGLLKHPEHYSYRAYALQRSPGTRCKPRPCWALSWCTGFARSLVKDAK